LARSTKGFTCSNTVARGRNTPLISGARDASAFIYANTNSGEAKMNIGLTFSCPSIAFINRVFAVTIHSTGDITQGDTNSFTSKIGRITTRLTDGAVLEAVTSRMIREI